MAYLLCTVECDSELKFVRQPPTEVECNPYIELSLICSVEGANTSNISIVWFRRTNIGSGMEELAASLERASATNGTRRFQSRFTRTGLNPRNDAGEYWCQVRLTKDGTLLQNKSNVLVLYNETHYQHQSLGCDDVFVNQVDCLHVANTLTDPMQSTPFSEISPTPDSIPEELEDGGKNLAALYAVVAVIAVFCIIIVTLTIIIVVLYRKKCGPVRFKTEGE